MRLRDLTDADLAEIATWSYDGAWAVYDSQGRLDPALGYWAVVADAIVDGAAVDGAGAAGNERLVGFACLGEDARVPGLAPVDGVTDVGVGMRPDLVGRGLGPEFARTVLDFAASRGAGRLRAVVQDWNERSLRLLDRLGFRPTGTHPVGEVTYVVVERDAAA